MRWARTSLRGVSVAKKLETFLHEMPFRLPAGPPHIERRYRDETRGWAHRLQRSLRKAVPKRTQALKNAIHVDVKWTDVNHGSIVLRIEDPAARALEYGGTVRGNPYMAIPLRRSLEYFDGPRETGTYVTVRSGDGRLFLIGARDKRFSYVLRRQVFVRRQPFILRTLTRLAKEFEYGVLNIGTEALIRGRRGRPGSRGRF